jgi:hypothetical protein
MPEGGNAAPAPRLAQAVPARELADLWQGVAPSPFAGQRLARMRLRNGWRLLAIVGLGMLLGVVLTSAIPQYDTLVANVQVQATIAGLDPLARNVEIRATNRRVAGDTLRAEDAAAGQVGAEFFSGFTQPAVTHYYSTDPVPLARIGASTFAVGGGERSAIFEAFDYTQAGAHMHLLAGRLPQTAPAGGAIEALVTSSMARAEGLQLGDPLTATFLGTQDRPVTARVVGIWEPTQPNENFWNGLSFEPIITDTAAIYSVLLDQRDYVTSMATLDLVQNAQHWVYYTDARRISAGGMGSVADAVNRARAQVPSRIGAASASSATVYSLLPAAITGLQRQLALLAQPLYIVVAQVVGLTLFFVVAMAELLVEDQAGEIAALKSRGASGGQLLGNYAGQSLLLGALAAVLGWQLAAPAARLLVHGFVPAATLRQAGVTDAYLAGLADPRASLAPALASALLGVVAVVVAVQRAARADVLAFRREQGRAGRQPLWRRLYLDVALAVVCLLGYFDLATFGGLDVRQQLGASGGGGSPLLLIAPALLLVAGALLLLRVFPVAVAAVGRFATRRRGALGMLALAQITRAPRGPSRLAALLALALGMGLFALTVDGSLIQNAGSRAAYQAGADVRLLQSGEEPGPVDRRLRAALAALPGVRGVTPVYRANINVNGSADVGTLTANLLGVDPATWETDAGAIAWRADYADAPLADLMRAMRQRAWRADALGGGQVGDPRHPVWALVNQTLADALHLRVGQRFPIYFGDAQTTPANAIVGAIIQQFPTLYPAQSQAGYLVVSLSDATAAYLTTTQSDPSTIGPTEYWLRTDDNPAHLRALRGALANDATALDFVRLLDRRQIEQAIATNPIQVGMRGLLLLGAAVAAALALLGSVIQSALAARQRAVRFAVLRTLGMARRQLTRLLLVEQLVIYAFGLLAGTLLGAVLALATLRFLQFGDTALDPATLGVPSYVLAIDPLKIALFYGVLLLSVALALAAAAFYANTVGLGKALRLGED